MLSCPVYPGLTLIHNLSIKSLYWAGSESRRVFSCHGSMSSECQPVSLNWQFRVVKWDFNKLWGMQQRSVRPSEYNSHSHKMKWNWHFDIRSMRESRRWGGLRNCLLREEWGVCNVVITFPAPRVSHLMLMWRVTHPVTRHTSQHWCEIIFSFHRIIPFEWAASQVYCQGR